MKGILSREKTIENLQQLNPNEFEEFIADVWKARGFSVTLRKKTGDRGVDIEAMLDQKLHLIQVKRYTEGNKVSSREIRSYATLYQQIPDADKVVLVTSGDITAPANSLANDLDVELVGSNELFEIVNQHAAKTAIEYLHSTPALSGSGEETHPFENDEEFLEVLNDHDFFNVCPQ